MPYVHDINPYFIKLWEGGPIRWYAVSYLAGFCAGYLLIKRISKLGHSPLQPQKVGDFVLVLALGVMVGGRLGYAIFYQPSLLVSFGSSLPYWHLLAVNEGGMASHGGVIGLLVAGFWYARRHHLPWLHLLDLTTFAIPIGLFFGRIANFVNGELYGRACSAQHPLAVKFPQEMHTWDVPQLQRISGVVELVGVQSTQWIQWLSEQSSSSWQQISHTIARLIERLQSGPRSGLLAEQLGPHLTPRHPSQLYQALLEGVVLGLVLLMAWCRPQRPGVIFGLGCTVYSIVRVFAEQFREPDSHIAAQEFAAWGITRGQWLSGLMFVLGISVLAIARRRNVSPLGGWRRPQMENSAANR